MTTNPTPSDFETHTNATYEALMWALSRPGLPRQLPSCGPHAIVDALIDRECAVFCEDAALSQAPAHTGAQLVTPEAADHLFLTQEPSGALLSTVRQGSDMYPEDGATLIIPAVLGSGSKLRLSGPGVDGVLDVQVSGALLHKSREGFTS